MYQRYDNKRKENKKKMKIKFLVVKELFGVYRRIRDRTETKNNRKEIKMKFYMITLDNDGGQPVKEGK